MDFFLSPVKDLSLIVNNTSMPIKVGHKSSFLKSKKLFEKGTFFPVPSQGFVTNSK